MNYLRALSGWKLPIQFLLYYAYYLPVVQWLYWKEIINLNNSYPCKGFGWFVLWKDNIISVVWLCCDWMQDYCDLWRRDWPMQLLFSSVDFKMKCIIFARWPVSLLCNFRDYAHCIVCKCERNSWSSFLLTFTWNTILSSAPCSAAALRNVEVVLKNLPKRTWEMEVFQPFLLKL